MTFMQLSCWRAHAVIWNLTVLALFEVGLKFIKCRFCGTLLAVRLSCCHKFPEGYHKPL